jgi:tRNA(fMet)-specific endonuclease VapC
VETVKRLCVDTDILVDYLRGRQPGKTLYSRWREMARILLTSVVSFELLVGAKISSNPGQRLVEVRSLIDQHEILPFDEAAAEIASDKGAELKEAGLTVEIRDLLNSSICLANGLPILTKNRSHYERVSGLQTLSVD